MASLLVHPFSDLLSHFLWCSWRASLPSESPSCNTKRLGRQLSKLRQAYLLTHHVGILALALSQFSERKGNILRNKVQGALPAVNKETL